MANDNSSIAFSIYQGGKLTREVSFDRAIVNIGKLSTSNLRLNDANSSRKHAVVERLEDGAWRATDLGSTNGTSLNGKRMTQEALRDGDRLLIGNTTLVVRLQAGEEGATVAAPRRRPEEIQGLGEDSFYSAEQDELESDDMVLEIALLWGETVLTIEHFNKPETIIIGEEVGARFSLPEEALGVVSFPLVEPINGQYALNLSLPHLEGDLLADGSVMPIGELDKDGQLTGHHYIIEGPVRARLRLGDFVLLISYSRMPARPKLSPLGSIDYNPFIFVSLSAILHIAFLVFLSLTPPEQLISKLDRDARRAKLIEILKIQQPEEEEEIEEELEDESLKAEDREEDEKPAPETLVDKLNEPKPKKIDTDALSPDQKKDKARELVQDTALAQELSQDTGLLSELLAENDENMMIDDRLVRTLGSIGGEDGPMLGAAGAVDPFSGTLDSGGNRGFATQGSVGAGGGGTGTKLSGKKSLDKLNFKERKLIPVAIAQRAKVSGRLDRKTVQRIIRQNLSGIKWCYQDALQRNKSLKGKVKLAFTILPNGNVANPKAINPSIKDQKLLSCITKRMKRWRFPAPKEGGVVKVSYPLLLKTR
jgi:pSer/pThr/pTyr-binding forkhead associated (FHA) protein/outer membrane biosynthesis protein TonB